METLTKCCTKCKEVKPLDGFHKNKSRKDGYNGHCKQCLKKYQKCDKWKEYQKEYQKKYYYSDKKKEYLIKFLRSDNRTISQIKDNLKQRHQITNLPKELIECKLLIIKTKRLCKTLNN